MYRLPWQNREKWGVEDISHVRWGSHYGPRSPSCSEDLASGRWGGGFPISHSLLCFSAFLQTFPASVWFNLPFVPLRSQPPILVWETSMKPLTFHSGGGVYFQELYLLSMTSTDLGKDESSVCSDTLLIQSLAINSKLPTDYCPWKPSLLNSTYTSETMIIRWVLGLMLDEENEILSLLSMHS